MSTTSLHSAIVRGSVCEVVELVTGGADVNTPHETSHSPLHCACIMYDMLTTTSQLSYELDARLAVIRVLLTHGAEVNATRSNGRTMVSGITPLHDAVRYGLASYSLVSMLLEHGADALKNVHVLPTRGGGGGLTSPHEVNALEHMCPNLLALTVERGDNCDDGQYRAYESEPNVFTLLLDRGVDPEPAIRRLELGERASRACQRTAGERETEDTSVRSWSSQLKTSAKQHRSQVLRELLKHTDITECIVRIILAYSSWRGLD
jgi:hypothetical protein